MNEQKAMTQKTYQTSHGTIVYWIGEPTAEIAKSQQQSVQAKRSLIFLPGLTADHRLFDKQIEVFSLTCQVLTWDPPGHGLSRPFSLDFSLMDQAAWLREILDREGIRRPVLVGQSMGGYVSQCFLELYPDVAGGFLSIDSAPLQRRYVTAAEIWLLKRAGTIYRLYPWKQLQKAGATGCACTGYGRRLMRSFLESYSKEEYCELAQHGYSMLAEAFEANLVYSIPCPAILLCGEKDRAGSTKRYNKAWAKVSGLPLCWIKGAGHNSNTDCPDEVNRIIQEFLKRPDI